MPTNTNYAAAMAVLTPGELATFELSKGLKKGDDVFRLARIVFRLASELAQFYGSQRMRDPVKEPPAVGQAVLVVAILTVPPQSPLVYRTAQLNPENEWFNDNWHRNMPNDGVGVRGWWPLPDAEFATLK